MGGGRWKGKGISEVEPRQKERPLNPRFSIGKYETHFRRWNVQPKDDLSANIAYEIKGIEYVSVIVRRTTCNRTEMIRPIMPVRSIKPVRSVFLIARKQRKRERERERETGR